MKRKLPTIAHILFLAEGLSDVQRDVVRGSRMETDMEHTQLMNFLFTLIKPELADGGYLQDVDASLVHDMINIHDMVKIYAGSNNTLKGMCGNREQEYAAAREIFEDQPRLLDLFFDYAHGTTKEARLCLQLDILQEIFSQISSQGRSWKEMGVTLKQERIFSEWMADPSNEFPPLNVMRVRLLQYAAANGYFAYSDMEDEASLRFEMEDLTRFNPAYARDSRLRNLPVRSDAPVEEPHKLTAYADSKEAGTNEGDWPSSGQSEEDEEWSNGVKNVEPAPLPLNVEAVATPTHSEISSVQKVIQAMAESMVEEATSKSSHVENVTPASSGIEEVTPTSSHVEEVTPPVEVESSEELARRAEKEAALKASTASVTAVKSAPPEKAKKSGLSIKEQLANLNGLTD